MRSSITWAIFCWEGDVGKIVSRHDVIRDVVGDVHATYLVPLVAGRPANVSYFCCSWRRGKGEEQVLPSKLSPVITQLVGHSLPVYPHLP